MEIAGDGKGGKTGVGGCGMSQGWRRREERCGCYGRSRWVEKEGKIRCGRLGSKQGVEKGGK